MRAVAYILFLFLFSFTKSETGFIVSVNDIPTEVIAGDKVLFQFKEINKDSKLLLYSSYGKTILKPESENKKPQFKLPEFITRKAGIVNWKFISGDMEEQGTLTILPLSDPEVIENYFGPRSIQAGNTDFSMLVSIPTDRYDNPLSDSTRLEVSEYFKGNLETNSLKMKNMFAWKNINSREQSGKITISNTCRGINAKEMISFVYPSTAVDFGIIPEREHEYADGNQITQIKTTQIKDLYGNTVSDGTMVEFIIEKENGSLLKSNATTIAGVAKAQLLHPETPGNWKIKANITGMADSNEIILNYKPVIDDFKIEIDREQGSIKVGPLRSFVNQLIPDGAEVMLKVFDADAAVKYTMYQSTKDGFAIFSLPEGKNLQDSYTFQVETLGATKTIQ